MYTVLKFYSGRSRHFKMLASESRLKGVFQKSEIAQGLCHYNYTVIHKKRGSTLVIITLENLDGFE